VSIEPEQFRDGIDHNTTLSLMSSIEGLEEEFVLFKGFIVVNKHIALPFFKVLVFVGSFDFTATFAFSHPSFSNLPPRKVTNLQVDIRIILMDFIIQPFACFV